MRGVAFDPADITIGVGETVTWTNMDFLPHTATSGDPGDADAGSIFDSGTLTLGRSFSHTFDEAGEFVYFCEFHPTMMRDAKVIVEAPQ
jgi:plastocyanin